MKFLLLIPAAYAQLMVVTLMKTVNLLQSTAPSLEGASLCFSDESSSVVGSTISADDSDRESAPTGAKNIDHSEGALTLDSSSMSTLPLPQETERPLFFGPTLHLTDREHEYWEPQKSAKGSQNKAEWTSSITSDQKRSQAIGTEFVEITEASEQQPRPTVATTEPIEPIKETTTEHLEDRKRIQSIVERLLGKSGNELSPQTPYTNGTSGPETDFSSRNGTLGYFLKLSFVSLSVSTGKAYTSASSSNLQLLLTEGSKVNPGNGSGRESIIVESGANEDFFTAIVSSGETPLEEKPYSLFVPSTAPNQGTNTQNTGQPHGTETFGTESTNYSILTSLFLDSQSEVTGSTEATMEKSSPWKNSRIPEKSKDSRSRFENRLGFFTVTETAATPLETPLETSLATLESESSEHGAGSEDSARRAQSPETENTNSFNPVSPKSTEGPPPESSVSLGIQTRATVDTSKPGTKTGENGSVFLPVSETTSLPPSVSVPDSNSPSTSLTVASTITENGTTNAKNAASNGTTEDTLVYIASSFSNTSAPFTFPHISLTKASTNLSSTSPETSPDTATALILPPRTRPPVKTQAGSVSGTGSQNQPWYRSLYIVVLGVVL